MPTLRHRSLWTSDCRGHSTTSIVAEAAGSVSAIDPSTAFAADFTSTTLHSVS